MEPIKAFININKDLLVKKGVDKKLLLVMAFLRFNASITGKVTFSINYLVKSLGYTPNSRKGKINDEVFNQLLFLEENNYISILTNTKVVKPNDCFQIQIIDSIFFEPKKNYVVFKEEEFEKITSAWSVDQGTLLSVFLNIKKMINFDPFNTRPKVAFPALRTVQKNCNIKTVSSVNNAINELERIGLLFIYRSGTYIHDGKVKNAPNLYATNSDELNSLDCERFVKGLLKDQGIEISEFKSDKEKTKVMAKTVADYHAEIKKVTEGFTLSENEIKKRVIQNAGFTLDYNIITDLSMLETYLNLLIADSVKKKKG
jgi:hypothetical protein